MVALLKIVLFFIWVCAIVGVLVSTLALCKNENTYKNRKKIFNAINAFAEENEAYRTALLLMHSMEDYTKTLWRWWDWGCTRILKKEDYELIKPYLEEKNGKKRRID